MRKNRTRTTCAPSGGGSGVGVGIGVDLNKVFCFFTGCKRQRRGGEMKENARLASDHPHNLGAKQLIAHLVSNAFEGSRGVPILGIKAFLDADEKLASLFNGTVDGRPALVVSEGIPIDPTKELTAIKQGASVSHSHGGFDNDCATMNSVLTRILGSAPKRLFSGRDLHY